jgi:hypothetical protein
LDLEDVLQGRVVEHLPVLPHLRVRLEQRCGGQQGAKAPHIVTEPPF